MEMLVVPVAVTVRAVAVAVAEQGKLKRAALADSVVTVS